MAGTVQYKAEKPLGNFSGMPRINIAFGKYQLAGNSNIPVTTLKFSYGAYSTFIACILSSSVPDLVLVTSSNSIQERLECICWIAHVLGDPASRRPMWPLYIPVSIYTGLLWPPRVLASYPVLLLVSRGQTWREKVWSLSPLFRVPRWNVGVSNHLSDWE